MISGRVSNWLPHLCALCCADRFAFTWNDTPMNFALSWTIHDAVSQIICLVACLVYCCRRERSTSSNARLCGAHRFLRTLSDIVRSRLATARRNLPSSQLIIRQI